MTESSLISPVNSDCVADLRWLLNPDNDLLKSLPPFTAFEFAHSAYLEAWLLELQQNPEPLYRFLGHQRHGARLGLYFESLLRFYFRYCPVSAHSLVGHNIKLYGDLQHPQRTTGELDFLLQDRTGLKHLEVAVKFYLGRQRGEDWQWLGPNPTDTLARKVAHLSAHQLPISANLRYGRQAIKQRLFLVKGALFTPWQAETRDIPTPDYCQPYAHHHYWLYQNALEDFFAHHTHTWFVLQKQQWLSCVSEKKLTHWQQLLNTKAAQMLVTWENGEPRRLMVMHNEWPLALEDAKH